ncbi:unnamed protein product, partial [Effrenium voratum]
VGIIFGPMTTTFQRCASLEDPVWCCFSILFPDRTLDLAVLPSHLEGWFLGLQDFLTANSACVSCISEAQLVFKKVFHKIRYAAHAERYTTWAHLSLRLRELGRDKAFRKALEKARAGGAFEYEAARPTETEAEAKAEKRRRRRESREADTTAEATGVKERPKDSLFAPPARDGVSGSPSPSPSASPSSVAPEKDDTEELQALVRELETQLESTSKRMKEEFGSKPMPDVAQVLQQEGAWQRESCAEIERELVELEVTHRTMQRKVEASEKVEKQLKRLAKQYKESDTQAQAMEQQLGPAKAKARGVETARRDQQECSEVETSHLERRVKELQEQLLKATKPGDELKLLNQQNESQVKALEKLEAEKAELAKRLQALEEKQRQAQQRVRAGEAKAQAAGDASRRLVQFLKKLKGEVGHLKASHKELKAGQQLRGLTDEFPPLAGAVQNIGASMSNLLDRYQEVAEERKKLHNLVLELKGNIRVFVRVRPMNEKEKSAEASGEATLTFAEDFKVSVYDGNQQRRKWFEFDKAFQPKSSQQEVYEEVKPLATSVLDGYNVCIFAYGQTGSGKTFTMTGNESNPGLNTRVLRELFLVREQRKQEVEINISLSVTEIYNEMIKDLFNPDSAKNKKLDVKQNPDGTNTVPGLTERAVTSVEQVLEYMKEAQSNRTVMATDMNDESSRSHSIVQVKTVNVNRKDKTQYLGKINLIDLAGSENVNRSGVQGQGMREAQNINRSLFALGDVIASLVSKNGHVPYRNSKLTMMLKDSLGGDSKTLMIVQCSPAQTNVTETLSSLTFASRARNVELGKAKKNVKAGDKGD